MSDDAENPFERFGIDPLEGAAAITERLRELAEDAPTPAERDAVRAAWEELTMHPARRLRAALGAAPETRAPIGRPPRAGAGAEAPIGFVDLAPRPSVAEAVPPGSAAPVLPSFADDPVVGSRGRQAVTPPKKTTNVL